MSLAAIAVAALLLSPAQEGPWTGKLDVGSKAAKVSFEVTRDGRRLERFKTSVAAFCVGPSIELNRIQIFAVFVPLAKVHSNGRFTGVYEPRGKDSGEYRVSGTLRGTRVRNGHVDVNVGTCGGHDKWTARRASR
jgi:hypothetical protein